MLLKITGFLFALVDNIPLCVCVCVFICVYMLTQSCSTICDPWTVARQDLLSMEILQARILEWVAIFYSRESSQPRNWTLISCIGRWILYPWGNHMYKGILHLYPFIYWQTLFSIPWLLWIILKQTWECRYLFFVILLYNTLKYIRHTRNSLVVQWLRLLTFTAKSLGSVPGWGTKIPHAVLHNQIHRSVYLPSPSFFLHCLGIRASLVVQTVKNPPAMWETWVPSLGWEDPLEEGMATHSNIQ